MMVCQGGHPSTSRTYYLAYKINRGRETANSPEGRGLINLKANNRVRSAGEVTHKGKSTRFAALPVRLDQSFLSESCA